MRVTILLLSLALVGLLVVRGLDNLAQTAAGTSAASTDAAQRYPLNAKSVAKKVEKIQIEAAEKIDAAVNEAQQPKSD